MTFWDFYSKFLHYNLFVYAKMYGKINCRIDKKRGEKRGEEIGPVCNSIGLIFIDGDEGDPALINFPLQSICVNNQTYQTGEYQSGTGLQESD